MVELRSFNRLHHSKETFRSLEPGSVRIEIVAQSAAADGMAQLAKSRGGTMHLDHLIERGFEALAFRYFLLGSHYAQRMNLSDEALAGAQAGYRRLLRHARELREATDHARPRRGPRGRACFRPGRRGETGVARRA